MKTLFTFLTIFFVAHTLRAQEINVAAAVRYFELADSLRKDRPLSDEAWNNYLQMEGNQQYFSNQGYSEKYLARLRKDMEVVYMPQHDSLLQERLKTPQKHFGVYLLHYYKANEPELRTYLQKIASDEEAYLDALYAETYSLLPKRLQHRKNEATVYFIGLSNDALANNGNAILTLWGAYMFDKIKHGALGGHELHHLLLQQQDYKVDAKDESLLLALRMLLNEGAPDLIDKRYTSHPDMPEEMRFGEYLLQTGKESLPRLDEAIREMAAGKKTYSAKEMKQQVIGMSGHIPGFYMADVIERNGLKKKLITRIDNPFHFIYLYNQAAKKDEGKPFVFSEEALAYLKKMEATAKANK